jgi:hypothetical protein
MGKNSIYGVSAIHGFRQTLRESCDTPSQVRRDDCTYCIDWYIYVIVFIRSQLSSCTTWHKWSINNCEFDWIRLD